MASLEEANKEYIDFISSVRKLKESRKSRVSNSLGVYDAYKWIRKNKWLGIGTSLTEHDFYSNIRSVNKELAKMLIEGQSIKFPCRMGGLELRKHEATYSFKDGKVVTNLPVDWPKTTELWYNDRESYDNKILVRIEEKEIFRIHYNKMKAKYNNKVYYEFIPNRSLKRSLKFPIKDNNVDAFKL